jgi:hypothetical protein
VVAAGLAVGFAQFVQERPVEGLQEYVLAPLAFSTTDPPAHTAVSDPASTLGSGFTVSVKVVVAVQPVPLVPVTV